MIVILTRTLLLLCLLVTVSCQPSLPKNVEPEIAYPVPDFTLVERGGKTVTKTDLLGKVWVASFVFTRCSGPCPAVTATVARLQSELAHEPNVRFVTFTIDPDRDTPDELKKYADRFRADPERWLFLTGKEAIVHELATSGFKLLAMKKPGGAAGDEFDHSSRLAIIDKSGIIRGYYDGMPTTRDGAAEVFENNLKKLRQHVATFRN